MSGVLDDVYAGLPATTSKQTIIPAYPYFQYSDDDDIQGLFGAQNEFAANFLAWFNTLNLPIYTGGIVAGALLDWVGQGLYGIARPSVTTGTIRSAGAMNAFAMNTVAMNARRRTSTLSNQLVSDDIYRRVLTWNLYKGDGFTFCIQWLKRRVFRFLFGLNGISPFIDQTYAVSVAVAGTSYTIAVPSADTTAVALLNALIQSGACITPFQYSFSVSTVLGPTGFQDDGGVLQITNATGYPTSATGLAAGAVWNNFGSVAVVPGVTPNPSAPPVSFTNVTAAQLLAMGGGNLPLSSPGVGTFILWNNNGLVCVSSNIGQPTLLNNGGALAIQNAIGFPLSPAGLAPGAIYNNGGEIAVVPGVTPNPAAAPVLFGSITALQLLALGGGNLPVVEPASGTLILWNNGGVVCIA